MLSVIMAAADREIVFRPNDLRANAEATSLKADLYGAGLDAGVPDISHDPGEQRPGLTPIGTVVILTLPTARDLMRLITRPLVIR